MNLTALLYKAVQGFRGANASDSNGAAGLAPFIGITSTSLSHKVSPTYPTANLSPDEFFQVMKITGDHSAFFKIAFELGYAPMPMPDIEKNGREEFTSVMTKNIQEFGEGLQAASNAFQRPCPENISTAHKEVIDSIRANLQVFASLDAESSAKNARSFKASNVKSIRGKK